MLRRFKFIRSPHLTGYVFISPFLFGFFCFTLIPLLASLYLAFTDYDVLSPPRWVGIDNFVTMFTMDERYWKAVKATLYYVFFSVPMRLAFALLVAMILNMKMRFLSAYRTIYYLPSIIGGSIAVSIMWRQLFGSDGAINSLLSALGIESSVSWILHPTFAIWTLILLGVWQFGASMLIFLAGLKQIPVSLYEAANIDGANAWHKFTRITLPLLSPVIFFNLIMQVINGFKAFTESFVITEGGPFDSTLFYAVYLYQKSFTFFSMGYGSAMAWVLLFIIAAITLLIFRTSSNWVHYESKGGSGE
jgi:multiple sugar transport system permease protein